MATGSLSIVIDMAEIREQFAGLTKQLEEKLTTAAASLAIQTHAHVKEQAQSRLTTRREAYVDALQFEQLDAQTWAITVPQKIRWIEDGMPAHDMLEDLLKSPKAKTSKDGGKYIVIPFKHNKGPTQQTPMQASLLSKIKSVMKEKKIPYGKIEKNADGSPKQGLLHSIDIKEPNPKAAHHTNHILEGIRVYQKGKKNADGSPKLGKDGHQAVSREVMTFRIASSKHKGTGKWQHPGLEAMNFLDEAYEWAMRLWESEIQPEILRSLNIS